jgi:broad specificity phosphatase PhoE
MYEERTHNKYWTRYPRGESYADVVQRLEPRIVELERMKVRDGITK